MMTVARRSRGKTFNMYRFDLGSADNNGQINEADEPIEDIEPALRPAGADDDNQNSSSDLSDPGPISGEDV
jgi:hypothetical protein